MFMIRTGPAGERLLTVSLVRELRFKEEGSSFDKTDVESRQAPTHVNDVTHGLAVGSDEASTARVEG
jgi:hypothetical protein